PRPLPRPPPPARILPVPGESSSRAAWSGSRPRRGPLVKHHVDDLEAVVVDKDAFLALARTWAATVTVVTARRRPSAITPEAPEVDGFTVTAFMMLSLEPPLLALGVARASGAHHFVEAPYHLPSKLLSERQAQAVHTF